MHFDVLLLFDRTLSIAIFTRIGDHFSFAVACGACHSHIEKASLLKHLTSSAAFGACFYVLSGGGSAPAADAAGHIIGNGQFLISPFSSLFKRDGNIDPLAGP